MTAIVSNSIPDTVSLRLIVLSDSGNGPVDDRALPILGRTSQCGSCGGIDGAVVSSRPDSLTGINVAMTLPDCGIDCWRDGSE